MRCEICHTDHAPHQAHVFPSQRQGTAPHAGLHARTCAECATLRAKIAELRAENDGLRAALDMAMEPSVTIPVTTPDVTSVTTKRNHVTTCVTIPSVTSGNVTTGNKAPKRDRAEYMRKRRAREKANGQ